MAFPKLLNALLPAALLLAFSAALARRNSSSSPTR